MAGKPGRAKPGFLTLRGGKLRGKRIAIAQAGVRPTTDRAREQAFNLIDQHFRHDDGRKRWAGARVLDAFAGTGALGMEAVSRGAGPVTFWDTSAREVAALQALGQTASRQSALAPPRASAPLDLLFLDPPYAQGFVPQALSALAAKGWLNPATLIYLETELEAPLPSGFDLIVERRAATSILRLVRQSAP